MPDNHDYPCAQQLGCELEATEYVVMNKISSHARHEHISDALVKNNFRLSARINTGQ
jgi:hypothetical protein